MTSPLPPLVVHVGNGVFVWVQNGRGWLLRDGKWVRLSDAPGLGGWVLSASQIDELVAATGRPHDE